MHYAASVVLVCHHLIDLLLLSTRNLILGSQLHDVLHVGFVCIFISTDLFTFSFKRRNVTSIDTLIKSALQFVLVLLFVFLGLAHILPILLGKGLVLFQLRILHPSIGLGMLD